MRRSLIITVLLAALPAVPVIAALPAPLDEAVPTADPTPVPAVRLALPDGDALAREDAVRRAEGLPYRFAVPEDVAFTPTNSGIWTDGADGRRVWRLRVVTPGATSLNLGFNVFDLPPSARLAVYPAADPAAGLVWDARDVRPHRQLWTPVLAGAELVVELVVAVDEIDRVDLELGTVGRGYRGFGVGAAGKSGSCNVDVVCPEGDNWRDEIKSVAVFGFGGAFICTGAMINNTAEDNRPLFLTANHCGVAAGNAASVVVYWNYESPTCGLQGGGSPDQSQSGSTWLAAWGGTDFTLLELDDQPLPAFDVRWAGWDRRDRNNLSSVGIHHPSGDEKSISFDDDPSRVTSYQGVAEPGDGTHVRVDAWDLGTTEPGSSGSPLFNEEHRITGQLHGGLASCANPDAPDWYGRLSASWAGGGEPTSRLSDHLDPLGTGADYLAMLGTGLILDPAVEARFTGGAGGPFSPTVVEYTLTNTGGVPLDFSFEIPRTWFYVGSEVGPIPPGGSRNFQIGLNDAADALPPGSHTGQLRAMAQPAGTLEHEIDVRLIAYSRRATITAIAPNPSRGRLTTVHYRMGIDATVRGRVYDLRGRLVADLGSWSATVGEQDRELAIRTPEGGLLAGGIYVLELEAGGDPSRERFAIVH